MAMQSTDPVQPFPSKHSLDEDRSSDRRNYGYCQRIAPMIGGGLPRRGDFFEVECCDICRGGLSFFFPRQPEFEQLVVELGRPPLLTYFSARVVYIEQVQHRGTAMHRLGCRFTHRVRLAD